MTSYSQVQIANTAEAFQELLKLLPASGPGAGARLQHEHDLGQRALFWGGDDRLIVTSAAIPDILIQCASHQLGWSNVGNVWPKRRSTCLCRDVLDDERLLEQLSGLALACPEIAFSAYASTPEYGLLIDRIRGRGAIALAPDLPRPEDRWTTSTLDSKAAFRGMFADHFQQGGLDRLPAGSVCISLTEVEAEVSRRLRQGGGFVLKVHNGESGWGTKIVRAADAPAANDLEEWISMYMRTDPIWERGPYIVEEFVVTDAQLAGGFPSAEGCITDSGVHFDYLCGQDVSPEGEFLGVILGPNLCADQTLERIQKIAISVGERLHEIGYRGTFDVDLAASRDGSLYILEANLRRTGGTHAHRLLVELARDPSRTFAVSNDSVVYPGAPRAPGALVATLAPLFYQKEATSGIFLTYVGGRESRVGVVAVAETREECFSLLSAARRLLEPVPE
jgi:hypothetical protein